MEQRQNRKDGTSENLQKDGGMEDRIMLLKLEHIYKDYVQGQTDRSHCLKDICFQVERRRICCDHGPSGSGKTTLMNIIGCLDVASSGVYQLNGTDLKDFDDRTMAQIRNRSIGFVFQTFNLLPKQTALDNVALPLLYSNVSKKERMERAKAALETVGLRDRLEFQTDAVIRRTEAACGHRKSNRYRP